MAESQLGGVGVAILVGYLLLTICIGLYRSRPSGTPASYFLAGRSSGWLAIGLSMFASNISSTTLVGLAGAAYAIGISVYNYEWMAGVVLVIFNLFFLPVLLRTRVFTLAEYLERRYDATARLYCAVLTMVLNVVVDAAGTLYAGAVVFRSIFPEWQLWQIAVLLAGCAALYTLLGGLRAVIATEVMQAVVMLGASAVLAFTALHAAGGWEAIVATVPAEKLSLIRPADDAGVPWPGLLFGIPLIGFYFWCTNQTMVQRVLSARSIDQGRRGTLLVGFLKLPLLLLMVLPGTAALVLFPDLPRADAVFPTLVLELLPQWLAGVVLAAFAGAVLSASASTFNSVATLATMGLLRGWRPAWSDRQLVRAGRWVVAGTAVIAVAWVPIIAGTAAGLWHYLQASLAYAVPPVVALFVGGVLLPRVNARGARIAILVGIAAGVLLMVQVSILEQWPMHFLLAAPIVFLVSLAGLWLGSLGAPAAVDATGLTWRSGQPSADGTSRHSGHLWLSLLLLATTALVVWWFR